MIKSPAFLFKVISYTAFSLTINWILHMTLFVLSHYLITAFAGGIFSAWKKLFIFYSPLKHHLSRKAIPDYLFCQSSASLHLRSPLPPRVWSSSQATYFTAFSKRRRNGLFHLLYLFLLVQCKLQEDRDLIGPTHSCIPLACIITGR